MGWLLSPQYGQVIQVSKYFVLTASIIEAVKTKYLIIAHNMDVKYQFAGSTLTRKCNISHWFSCDADGQAGWWLEV